MGRVKSLIVAIAVAVFTAGLPLAQSFAAPPAPDELASLRQQTAGSLKVSYHAQTGKVRFLAADPAHPVPRPAQLPANAGPEEAARGFLAAHGSLFGLIDQAHEVVAERTQAAEGGRSFVRFQQVHEGIPVLGGELIVQTDANQNVISANGEILPQPSVAVTPTVDAATAQARAREVVAKTYNLNAAALEASTPQLWLYNPVLLGPGLDLTRLVWRMDVQPQDLQPMRELVLVDAQLGGIALHFNQVDTALNRETYDAQSTPNLTLVLSRTEGQPATGIADVDNAHDYAGETYDFYADVHGRDSIDGFGMTIKSSVRYCPVGGPCPYPNAFWSDQYQQMIYGQSFPAARDVVAHELTHGVTSYESNLFYYMQSGAINEALSDIWGESVDQRDKTASDPEFNTWLIGENAPGGAARSMSDPPNPPYPCTVGACGPTQNLRQPDKMTSIYYMDKASLDPYYVGGDSGGVHVNSGVANKAAYLMAKGGAFNGRTVTPLGITKMAKVWYEVQTHFLTSGSDYQDLYDGLQQACANLMGVGVTNQNDCQQVKNAVDATEMNLQPINAPAPEAPLCPAGQSPQNIFLDDMENAASANWVAGTGWQYVSGYATSGTYSWFAADQPATGDASLAMAPSKAVLLPAGTSYLHFRHAYDLEDGYDGGVVEYTTDGGTTWKATDNPSNPLPTLNGYDGSISSAYGNPLAGRMSFTGISNGYMSSRFDLTSLAGQSVRFRFRIGTDSNVGWFGWLVDDVRIYTCGTPAPLDHRAYLPLVMRALPPVATPTATPVAPTATPLPPSGPTPGYWVGTYGDFYVTPDRAYVDDFAIYVDVLNCGIFKITHTAPVQIASGQFSFSGPFHASGTFASSTSASGDEGLTNFYIPDCGGYLTIQPVAWNANWYSNAQPAFDEATAEPNVVTPVSDQANQGRFYTITRLD